MAKKITCSNCGHSWDKSTSTAKDAHVCHICGKGNVNMKDGGWLNKYADVPKAQAGEDIFKITPIDVRRAVADKTKAVIPKKDLRTKEEAREQAKKDELDALAQKAIANQPAIQSSRTVTNTALEQERLRRLKMATPESSGYRYNESTGEVEKAIDLSPTTARTLNRAMENIVEPMIDIETLTSGAPLVTQGLKTLGKSTLKGAKNIIEQAPRAFGSTSLVDKIGRGIMGPRLWSGAVNFGRGVDRGLLELSRKQSGRSFSEIFPMTKAEIEAANLKAQQAGAEGAQFVRDWTYDKAGNIRHDVREKIEDILMGEGVPLKQQFFRPNYTSLNARMEGFGGIDVVNPFNISPDITVSSKTSEILKNPYIDENIKRYLINERHTMGGVNFSDMFGGPSITFSTVGPAYKRPSVISDIAAHETGHTMQNLGGQRMVFKPDIDPSTGKVISNRPTVEYIDFGKMLAERSPEYDYYIPNKKTKIGKKFSEVMVEPEIGKDNWKTSPNELHSELLAARKKMYDAYIKDYGMDPEDAMNTLKHHADNQIDWMMDQQNLHRFFKDDVTKEKKREMIRLLPALVPAVGIGAAATMEQKKNGGWLDKYETAQNGIEGTMGGLTDEGFNYNGAWGGPSMAMGGSLPGAVGFTYARTQGAAPANGKYTKKTKASAQNGQEMKFYQEGLDWKPRNISRDGSVTKDDNGYWNPDNWGKAVEIGSNNITMQGVNQPLVGVSDTGDTKMMYPGKDYKFKGKKVTEYPVSKKWLDKYK